MKKFIISRKKWARGWAKGKEWAENTLYNAHSKKSCCLGLIANQCEVPLKSMIGVGSPEEIDKIHIDKVKFMLLDAHNRKGWIQEAIDINDSNISEHIREKRLYSLFKKHKIELEFTE